MKESLDVSEMKITKVAKTMTNFLTVIAVVATLAMLVITITDVIMRFFLNLAFFGAAEYVRMTMICIVPAFAAAMLADRHVRVGILVDKLGRRGQLIFDTISVILTGGICSVIAWQIFTTVQFAIKFKDFYMLSLTPKWPFLLIFCCSMAVLVLAVIVVLIQKYKDKDAYTVKKDEIEEEIKRFTEIEVIEEGSEL